MIKRIMTVLLLVGMTRFTWADSTNLPVKISATEASQHYDQQMTVTGLVAQVTLRPSIVFINLDQPFPDSPFAAVIHSKDTNQFGDLKSLKGRSVEITGLVKKFKEKPEIVIEKPSQISVLGGWLAPANLPATPSTPAPATPAGPKAPKGTNDLTTGVM